MSAARLAAADAGAVAVRHARLSVPAAGPSITRERRRVPVLPSCRPGKLHASGTARGVRRFCATSPFDAIPDSYGISAIWANGRKFCCNDHCLPTFHSHDSAASLGGRVVTKSFSSYDGTAREISGVEFAEGRVLSVGSEEVRIMSDVWGISHFATYWDDTKGRPALSAYALDADVSCSYGSAEVDATDEVKVLAAVYYEGRERGRTFAAAERRAAEAETEAARKIAKAAHAAEVAARRRDAESSDDLPRVGDLVEVTKGNKGIPNGTAGAVFWAGWSARHDTSWRVGFKDASGATHWIAASGVKVTARGERSASPVPIPATAAKCHHMAKGDRVVIVAGPADGCAGRVIWVGADRHTGAPRVGVRSAHGEVHWVPADNVKAA